MQLRSRRGSCAGRQRPLRNLQAACARGAWPYPPHIMVQGTHLTPPRTRRRAPHCRAAPPARAPARHARRATLGAGPAWPTGLYPRMITCSRQRCGCQNSRVGGDTGVTGLTCLSPLMRPSADTWHSALSWSLLCTRLLLLALPRVQRAAGGAAQDLGQVDRVALLVAAAAAAAAAAAGPAAAAAARAVAPGSTGAPPPGVLAHAGVGLGCVRGRRSHDALLPRDGARVGFDAGDAACKVIWPKQARTSQQSTPPASQRSPDAVRRASQPSSTSGRHSAS
jgi:hypothetical protein